MITSVAPDVMHLVVALPHRRFIYYYHVTLLRHRNFVIKHYKKIFIFSIILIVLSLFSARNIQLKTQMKDMLPEDNPAFDMYEEVDKYFAGGTNIFLLIRGNDKNKMIGQHITMMT